MTQLFSPDSASISPHHLLSNVRTDSDDHDYLLLPTSDKPSGAKPRRLSFRGQQNQLPDSTDLKNSKLIPMVKNVEPEPVFNMNSLLTTFMYIIIAIPIPGFPQVLQRRALASIVFILISSISLILCSYGIASFRACMIINSLSGLDAAFAEMYIYRYKRLR